MPRRQYSRVVKRRRKVTRGSVRTGYRTTWARQSIVLSNHNRIHHFKQTFYPSASTIVTSGDCTYVAAAGNLFGPGVAAGTDGFFTYNFQLLDLPQVASFSALFDAYKINKILIKFIPAYNVFGVTGNPVAGGLQPGRPEYLTTVLDYDDNANLTTQAQLMEYDTFKQTAPTQKHIRSFKPAVAMNAFRTAVTSGYVQKKQQWIDIANTDVEHYGIKGCIQHDSTAANNIQNQWRVYVTAFFSCKEVR